MFVEELETILKDAGVITQAYLGSGAKIPDGDGPYLSIRETAGAGYEARQDVEGPSMIMPGAQIVARAVDPVAAHDLAWAAWTVLSKVVNQFVGGVWYRQIRAQQLPLELGLDSTNRRMRYSFNVIGDKKPS